MNRWYKPLDWVKIERKRQDKVVFDLACVRYRYLHDMQKIEIHCF